MPKDKKSAYPPKRAGVSKKSSKPSSVPAPYPVPVSATSFPTLQRVPVAAIHSSMANWHSPWTQTADGVHAEWLDPAVIASCRQGSCPPLANSVVSNGSVSAQYRPMTGTVLGRARSVSVGGAPMTSPQVQYAATGSAPFGATVVSNGATRQRSASAAPMVDSGSFNAHRVGHMHRLPHYHAVPVSDFALQPPMQYPLLLTPDETAAVNVPQMQSYHPPAAAPAPAWRQRRDNITEVQNNTGVPTPNSAKGPNSYLSPSLPPAFIHGIGSRGAHVSAERDYPAAHVANGYPSHLAVASPAPLAPASYGIAWTPQPQRPQVPQREYSVASPHPIVALPPAPVQSKSLPHSFVPGWSDAHAGHNEQYPPHGWNDSPAYNNTANCGSECYRDGAFNRPIYEGGECCVTTPHDGGSIGTGAHSHSHDAYSRYHATHHHEPPKIIDAHLPTTPADMCSSHCAVTIFEGRLREPHALS